MCFRFGAVGSYAAPICLHAGATCELDKSSAASNCLQNCIDSVRWQRVFQQPTGLRSWRSRCRKQLCAAQQVNEQLHARLNKAHPSGWCTRKPLFRGISRCGTAGTAGLCTQQHHQAQATDFDAVFLGLAQGRLAVPGSRWAALGAQQESTSACAAEPEQAAESRLVSETHPEGADRRATGAHALSHNHHTVHKQEEEDDDHSHCDAAESTGIAFSTTGTA